MSEITSKFCGGCQQEKPTENFYKEKRSKDGYLYRCKPCVSAGQKRFYKADPEKYKRLRKESRLRRLDKVRASDRARQWPKHLKRRYNITLEEFERMENEQKGLCAICGMPPDGNRLRVDHDHKTGKIRGLLCDKCNTRLPIVESPIWKASAEAYLEKY